jgi:hypothetical protein
MATAVMLMTTTLLAYTQAWVEIDAAKRRKPRTAKRMHIMQRANQETPDEFARSATLMLE